MSTAHNNINTWILLKIAEAFSMYFLIVFQCSVGSSPFNNNKKKLLRVKKSEIYGFSHQTTNKLFRKGIQWYTKSCRNFRIWSLFIEFEYFVSDMREIACWKERICAIWRVSCTQLDCCLCLSQYEKCVKFDNWQLCHRLRLHLNKLFRNFKLYSIVRF